MRSYVLQAKIQHSGDDPDARKRGRWVWFPFFLGRGGGEEGMRERMRGFGEEVGGGWGKNEG